MPVLKGAHDQRLAEAEFVELVGQGVEPGSVVEVLQRGYRSGDQVIRAARVVVGR